MTGAKKRYSNVECQPQKKPANLMTHELLPYVSNWTSIPRGLVTNHRES